MNRRSFLQQSAWFGAAAFAAPTQALSTQFLNPQSSQGERSLHLYNIHTGESLKTVFAIDGQYLSEGIQALDLLLRDHRSNQAIAMQHELYEKMYYLQQRFSAHSKAPLYIISGYRCPTSNASLSQKSQGVASNSLHTQGRAVDIRIPGVIHRDLHKAALSMRAGGVGYYPKDGFIHLDTGRIRQWQT